MYTMWSEPFVRPLLGSIRCLARQEDRANGPVETYAHHRTRVGNRERGCRGLRDRRRGDEEKIVRYHLKWLQLWMCEEVDAGAKRRSQWVHFVESRKDEDENIMTRALKKWRSVGKKYEKNSTCDLSVVGISPIRESQWRPAERT